MNQAADGWGFPVRFAPLTTRPQPGVSHPDDSAMIIRTLDIFVSGPGTTAPTGGGPFVSGFCVPSVPSYAVPAGCRQTICICVLCTHKDSPSTTHLSTVRGGRTSARMIQPFGQDLHCSTNSHPVLGALVTSVGGPEQGPLSYRAGVKASRGELCTTGDENNLKLCTS